MRTFELWKNQCFIESHNTSKRTKILQNLHIFKELKLTKIHVPRKSIDTISLGFFFALRPHTISEMAYFAFNDREQVIIPDKALPNFIMILDDIACEKQDSLKAFFAWVDI